MAAGNQQRAAVFCSEVADGPHGGEDEVGARQGEEGERVFFPVQHLLAGAGADGERRGNVQLDALAVRTEVPLAELPREVVQDDLAHRRRLADQRRHAAGVAGVEPRGVLLDHLRGGHGSFELLPNALASRWRQDIGCHQATGSGQRAA